MSGENVLVSRQFTYFGNKSIEPPEHLGFAIPGHGHLVDFTADERRKLVAFLKRLHRGRHGLPRRFVADGGKLSRGRVPPRCG